MNSGVDLSTSPSNTWKDASSLYYLLVLIVIVVVDDAHMFVVLVTFLIDPYYWIINNDEEGDVMSGDDVISVEGSVCERVTNDEIKNIESDMK